VSKLSVIIPARHELYLQQTVTEVLTKATGDIELIVILDGYWPKPILKDDKRLTIVHRQRRGMRQSINDAVSIAKGKYLMKIDGHCMLSEGYDQVLTATIEGNWIVVPRRYSLDAEKWEVRTERPWVDYEYLAWPYNWKFIKAGRRGMHGMPWDERIAQRVDKLFDENMIFQGSCWVMEREHFIKRIGWQKPELYGQFSSEAQELGLATWFMGGKIMTNKRAWYAHLWKGRGYSNKCKEAFGVPHTRQGFNEAKRGAKFVVDYWLHNQDKPYKHDIDWFIERSIGSLNASGQSPVGRKTQHCGV